MLVTIMAYYTDKCWNGSQVEIRNVELEYEVRDNWGLGHTNATKITMWPLFPLSLFVPMFVSFFRVIV